MISKLSYSRILLTVSRNPDSVDMQAQKHQFSTTTKSSGSLFIESAPGADQLRKRIRSDSAGKIRSGIGPSCWGK